MVVLLDGFASSDSKVCVLMSSTRLVELLTAIVQVKSAVVAVAGSLDVQSASPNAFTASVLKLVVKIGEFFTPMSSQGVETHEIIEPMNACCSVMI